MTRIAFLLLLCSASFAGRVCASAAPDAEQPVAVVQAFYDGYMKILATDGGPDFEDYVLNSDAVTLGFKQVYKAFMKEPESDPILCGQDYPDAGYRAGKAKIEGDTATVTMTSKDPKFTHTFKVYLKHGKEGWQITGTQDLKSK